MKMNFKKIISACIVLTMMVMSFAVAIPSNAVAYNENYFRYPVAATYESYGKAGFARGELTVEVNKWVNNNLTGSDIGCPTDAVVFWANEDGKLPGYSRLARFKLSTRSTTFEFPELQIIPEGADRLLVYTAIHGSEELSAQFVEAMLPEDCDYIPASEPVMSFVVISDTHIQKSDSAAENVIFKDMLNDVKKDFPEVKGIFINGDNAQSSKNATDTSALKSELENIEDYRSSICPKIPIFMAVGNHDLWPYKLYSDAVNTFLGEATLPDGSNPKSINYDFWLGGYHFVFLGSDINDPTYAKLNTATLEWLDTTLAEDYDSGRPTFIFLHQALSNTVAGSLTDFGQEWDGIINAVEVKNVLRKYPEAILFSGHSHYSLDSVGNAYDGGDIFPTTFNTASLARATARYGEESVSLNEAQGYIIEIYDDCVMVKGRDFTADEWKSSAQYVVDYSAEGISRPIPDNSQNNTSNGSNNNVQETGSANTEQQTEKPSATDAPTETNAVEKAGCGSYISGVALVFAVSTCAVSLVALKRKRKSLI